MSNQIETHMISDFKSGIDLLLQQMHSVFRGNVLEEPVNGEVAFFDQLGATHMTKRNSRHAKTVYTETPHARRMCPIDDWDVADLIDKPDKIRVLNDPTNEYSTAFAMAANRNYDDVVIPAATGTARTGKAGAGTADLAAAQQDTGTGPMTLARVLGVKEAFDEQEVADEDRHFVMHPQGFTDLLSTEQATSSDYVSLKALVHGEIDTWLGFKWHRSNRLEDVTSTVKRCFAWHKSGIKVGMGSDVEAHIDVMPGYRYSVQVYYAHSLGAVRMEEGKVFEIHCDNT